MRHHRSQCDVWPLSLNQHREMSSHAQTHSETQLVGKKKNGTNFRRLGV